MKNKELQPIYLHETNISSDNGISLVELAVILVRHKTMIIVIFSFFIALGVVTALSKPISYTYSTSIEIGSQIINGSVKHFESPQTLLAKLNHSFIPKVLNEQLSINPENNKILNIKVSVPKNSEIIILELTGTDEQSSAKSELLQKISATAIQDHKRIYDAVKQNHVSSIKQAEAELATLDPEIQSEKIERLNDKIETYNSQLANLRNTREISPPMKSLTPTGGSRKSIIIIASFAGLFLAIFAVFFVEFAAKVKEQISQ